MICTCSVFNSREASLKSRCARSACTVRGLRQLQPFATPSFYLSFFMLGVRQRRHVALRHEAFFVSRQNRLCRRVFFNRLWNNVYDRWITSNFPCRLTQKSKHNKWLEILTGEDFPLKLLWRTPTKIHRRRIEEGKREAERTSLSIAKATSSTQRPQTCTEASAKYYIITLQARLTASETDEERKHRLRTLQKATRRSGNVWSLQSNYLEHNF